MEGLQVNESTKQYVLGNMVVIDSVLRHNELFERKKWEKMSQIYATK